MAPNDKPVVLIVHGAFHTPSHYKKLIEQLRDGGYTVLAPPLPTSGLDDYVAGKTHLDDVKRIHDYLLPYLEQGKEAVILCHSAGGISGSAAVEGQTVAERQARGDKGGIRSIIYLAAFALPDRGQTHLGCVGGTPAPWWNGQDPVAKINEGGGEALFNMLSKEQRAAYMATLVSQSWASYHEPINFVASDITVPKTYIITTEDMAFPVPFQQMCAAATGCTVKEIKSDHSPFLADDRTKMVVEIVDEVTSV